MVLNGNSFISLTAEFNMFFINLFHKVTSMYYFLKTFCKYFSLFVMFNGRIYSLFYFSFVEHLL